MGIAGGTDSSSGEEDGDAEWKAAIDSVAAVDVSSSYGLSKFHATASNGGSLGVGHSNHADEKKTKAPGIKLYQIKAQKLLDDLLDKNIEMVTTHIPDNDNHQSDGGLVKLFRKAPPGMRLYPIDQDPGPQKKPKIIPGEDIDEKSKKFRRNIQSVAVNGSDIVAAARIACQSSLARWEARDTAAKEAAKREEERVAELKRIRGEKWLPSVAREMKVNGVACLLAQAFAFREAVHAIIALLVFAEPEGFIALTLGSIKHMAHCEHILQSIRYHPTHKSLQQGSEIRIESTDLKIRVAESSYLFFCFFGVHPKSFMWSLV